jgi:hypothetical protein
MTGHHHVPPISDGLPTQADAVAEARNHARQHGEPVIHVQELDGGRHDADVDAEFSAPTPKHVKGPVAPP